MLLAFLAIFLCSLMVTVIAVRTPQREKLLHKRMQMLGMVGVGGLAADGGIPSTGSAPTIAAASSSKTPGFVLHVSFLRKLQKLLSDAGSTTPVLTMLGISAGLAVACATTVHALCSFPGLTPLAGGAGAVAPWLLMKRKKTGRLKKMSEVLPDAIDLMARALRAGHSMAGAIEVIAEQSAEPLATEFERVFQEQKFGLPLRDALLNLNERVPTKDMSFLITAILVQKETGGDLTEILDRTTHVIRERVRIEGEIRTYTAQGRLTGWILAAMPVVMLILIHFSAPEYTATLFNDPIGHILLGIGSTLILIGGMIIRSIVNIEV